MFVQTEITPNPNSLKFLPGKTVSNSGSFEVTNKDDFNNELIRNLLSNHLSSENIITEVNYFNNAGNQSFERTYGWAWILKLAEELHVWDDPLAKQ